jgi:DnaJ-class molecular chaperone
MKIEICKTCDGTGEISEVDIETPHFITNCCKKCNGTGRVKTNSYSYTVPFDMDNNEIFEVDSEIVKLIINLQKTK